MFIKIVYPDIVQVCWLAPLFLFASVNAAEPPVWTLAASLQRAIEVAPQVRLAEAEVAVRTSELTQANAWTNPSIELRADNKLGQEDGRGGVDFTQFAISQPVPLWRLLGQQNAQRTAAEANIKGAHAQGRAQRLVLEQEVARVFHLLQFSKARTALVKNRVDLARSYGRAAKGKKRDPLVRYLTPLERSRLAVLSEEAEQTVVLAEKEYQLALAEFRSLLALPADAAVRVATLELAVSPAALVELESNIETHPALMAAQQQLAASRAGIAVAEAQRFNDPSFSFFRERDFLNGARRDVTGVGVSVQIPLWNKNDGPVDRSRAETLRAQAELDFRQRNALANLRQSHIKLARLVEQTEQVRTRLLAPAQQVLELTRRGFSAGESNVLALVDANNTYFEAQLRHLDLLRDSQLAAADLRLAAGQSQLAEVRP